MTYRSTRHSVFYNDENSSSTRLWLRNFLHRPSQYSSIITSSPLYVGCQNGDLVYVESCLKKMKFEQINYQYSPNNETALHIATKEQHKEIVKILLEYGALPSLRNLEGQHAYELAETEEIKDLFKRPKSSRFAFSQIYSNMNISSENKLTCKSCLLVDKNIMYEWELVDRNASHKAMIFRREYQSYPSINSKIWKKKLYSLNKGYLTAHPKELFIGNGDIIHHCFKRALLEENPNYLVTAYTSCQNFSTFLNINMARNVIHDLRNGCSQFSCQCLYLTGDGTKSIANIFLYHPNFQKLDFKGEIYRGIVMPKYQLDHYKVGSCILTTTFLSTSKNPPVAQAFGDKSVPNPATHSFFCTYKIVNNGRTAIDISKLSIHPEEDEVLILPYSPFLITKIEEEQERTKIYLEDQCLVHIFDGNQSHVH